MYRQLVASFNTGCGACPYGIRKGETICNDGAPQWRHVDCAVTVSKREPVAPKVASPSPVTISGLDGHYAVDDPDIDGNTIFLRIDAPAKDRWAGWYFVKQQHGPNYERIGTQPPGNAYHGSKAALIAAISADPESAMRRYGTELGRCGKCSLELTDAASRAYGIGPVCRKQLGW